MVALPLAPGCLRVRILGKINNQNLTHMMHLAYFSGTPSGNDCVSIANQIRAAWTTRMLPSIPSYASYTTFEVLDLGTLTGAIGTNTTTTPLTGTASTTAGASNAGSVVISWHVNYRYRGGHCRTYLPFGSLTSLSSGNTINSMFTNTLNTAANNFITSPGWRNAPRWEKVE